MLRAFSERDEPAVCALLRAGWPNDPGLREISAIYGLKQDRSDRWRRTLVWEETREVVGAGTLLGSARHPSHLSLSVVVAPDHRRRGIGSTLLAELRRLSDRRRQLARVRDTDAAGLAFLRAHGFGVLMRNRVGVVDPDDPRVKVWVAEEPGMPVDTGLSREELARAHEDAYRAEHATWAPASKRPIDESLRLFCGESWLAQSGFAVQGEGCVLAVAGLHGPPLAPSKAELFLIAGTASRHARALRAVVAAELDLARSLGAAVSIEADDANQELSAILDDLPAALEPTLLLLSTDAPAPVG